VLGQQPVEIVRALLKELDNMSMRPRSWRGDRYPTDVCHHSLSEYRPAVHGLLPSPDGFSWPV
jgi:hypothetical protein